MSTATLPDIEESEIISARLENGNRPTPKLQRRLNTLTRRIYELRTENEELRDDLQRALVLIDKYKRALREARRTNDE